MVNLISYFTKNSILSASAGLEIYDFTGDSIAFVQDCVRRFREAYISEEKLERIVAESKTATRKDAIERRLPQIKQVILARFYHIIFGQRRLLVMQIYAQ